MSARSRTALAAGLILVILAAGVAIGVVIGRRVAPPDSDELRARPPRGFASGRMLERFKRRLALDDSQANQVEAILEKARSESDSIHKRVGPELRAIRERTRTEIRTLLSPEQVKAYDQLIAEREKRREHRRTRPGHRENRKGHERSPEHSWAAVDTNKDGEISRAECESSEHPLGRMCSRRWESFDANGNGSIDKSEMKAAREAMHKKMREGWQ